MGMRWVASRPGLLLIALLSACAVQARSLQCRDRWLEPFSSDSIWNTAIGSAVEFKPARLFQPGDYRGNPAN
eukprot:SAG31_NODE_41654_length_275_cov_0.585227_1_plen_71_part_10